MKSYLVDTLNALTTKYKHKDPFDLVRPHAFSDLSSRPVSSAQENFIFAVAGSSLRSGTLDHAWHWYLHFLESKIRETWITIFCPVLHNLDRPLSPPYEDEIASAMKVLATIASQLRGRQDVTLAEIVDHLYNSRLLNETDDERSHAYQLVFAAFGWISKSVGVLPREFLGTDRVITGALYTPRPDPRPKLLEIDQPLGVRLPRSKLKTYCTYQQNLEYQDRPLSLLLQRFGKIIPMRNATRNTLAHTPGAAEMSRSADESWIELSTICYHTLYRISGITIEWVDCLSLHLEFDPYTRTVKIFRFPSVCLVMAESEQPSTLSQ